MKDFILPILLFCFIITLILVGSHRHNKNYPDRVTIITYEMGVIKEVIKKDVGWPYESTQEVKIFWLSDSILELKEIEDVWNIGDTLRLQRFKYEYIQKEK